MELKDEREDYGTIKLKSWGEVCQGNLHKQNIVERVDAMTLIKPFVIKEIDMFTLKRLIRYCRMNSKNDWALGIKMLLDQCEGDAKSMMLYEKLVTLEENYNKHLEVLHNETKKEEPKKVKTFGGGEV